MTGERQWEAELATLFPPAADGDGPYGAVSGCRFRALTARDEEWWSVPIPDGEGRGCSLEHFAVLDDRIVVVDGERVYAVRKRPGERRTLL